MTATMTAPKSPRERELRGHDTRRYQLQMRPNSIPKLCECGCGAPAPIAQTTNKKWGHVKGEPMRYVRGHSNRGNSPTPEHRAAISEHHTKHGHASGHAQTGTYRTWAAMIQRCTNEKSAYYAYYGGRGISVCERWRHSFTAFLDDMGERPDGLTIDRIDPDGDYEPDNSRWADRKMQARNTRITRGRS